MALQNPRLEDPARAERTGWLLVAAGVWLILAAVGLWRAHWPAAGYQQLALVLNAAGGAVGIAGGRMAGAARKLRRRERPRPLVLDETPARGTENPPASGLADADRSKGAGSINAGLLTLAVIVAVWGGFVGRPYAASIWAILLTPLMGLPLLFWSKGRVVVADFEKNGPPQLFPAFAICGGALFLRALDYPILGWADVFLWAALFSIPFAALAWWRSDPRAKGPDKVRNTAVTALIALFYGAGAIVVLDRLLDVSDPKFEYVKVTEKYVTGKRPSYRISAALPQAPGRLLRFGISQSAYDKAAVGDGLLVGDHKGALGVRWFDQRSRIEPGAQIATGKAVAGVTRMRCHVTPQGRLSDCVILSECPAGRGFGAASLNAARYFKMRPKMVGGRAVDGGQVVIPIKWKPDAGAEVPAACSATPGAR